ncbi:MAG: nodulation protein NfeD [Chloroflexi bacterium]|nr:nodulation protein NfeD [Chloroflexota bacterium]
MNGPARPLHTMLARPRALLGALALALVALGAACGAEGTERALHVVTIDRQVDGALVSYIDRAIDHAEDSSGRAVLLRIDTPGGEIGAMKEIVGRIERSSVPVITWVGPPGAEAVSAGTFIAMAGHIAAMAPSTTIGAATPITATGEDVEGDLGRKVTNDTVAFARGVAELHGRNADWAEAAVREASSATPNEALELNVIDLVAATETELLVAVEGRAVQLIDGRIVTLQLATAPWVENELNAYERIVAFLGDPFVVMLLLLIGMAGIATELFFAPGTFVPGVAGALALLLFFLGVGTLLPAEAALAFVVLAVLLLVLELFLPTGGVLGSGAALALAFAIGIGIGQGSTDLSIERLLVIVLAVIGVIALLLAAFLAYFAARYWAPTKQPEGESADST